MSITTSSAPLLLRFHHEQDPDAYGGSDSHSGPGDVRAAGFYGEAYENTYAAGEATGLEPGPDYTRTRQSHAFPSSSASSSRSASHRPTLAPAPVPEATRAGGGFPKRVAGTGTTTYPVGGTDVHAHGPDIGRGSSQSASRELSLAELMTFGPMPPALPLPSGHVLGRDGLDSGGCASVSHPDTDTLRLAPAMYKSDDAAYPRPRQRGFDIAGVPSCSFSPRPPTLAEMAIQYNDPAALQPQPLPLPVSHPLPRYPDQDAFVHEVEQEDAYDHTGMAAAAVADGDNDDDSAAFNDGREKRHACTMCHKRFDRPSTLKKHLLVHTGEKAFQCSICDRRFGVLSNLNRHVRRCSQREVHLHGPKARIARTEAAALAQADRGREAKRGLGLGGTVKAESASTTTGTATAATPKRRRRPPSPSRWVPPSLRTFRLLAPEDWPASSLPLEPVSPIRPSSGSSSGSSSSSSSAGVPVPFWPNGEDRDSYDENVGQAPYRSDEYDRKKRLPGPAAVYGVFAQGKGKNTGRFGGAGAGGNQGSGRREVVAW
ncbi:C2H2 conidiation transcriptional factor [Mycena chlorophos]|uniref:C2H2 conidiation transcriptional factor n=1 Tax=Mycena chlorophos TaxID=658473 RepID=A0A8H6VU09_MYCCL|nr:C2H2 conidiation transcriptional factor [Mycena chlorophos]